MKKSIFAVALAGAIVLGGVFSVMGGHIDLNKEQSGNQSASISSLTGSGQMVIAANRGQVGD